MCTTNSRRICFLCILLYCFTCVKPGRNPNVPRGSRVNIRVAKVTEATTLKPKVEVTQADEYYMEKDYFVSKLMTKYGDGTHISYEGLEHLLYNLGLGKIEHMDHGIEDHKFGDGHSHDHDHSHDHSDHSHDDHHHDDHSHDDHHHDDHSLDDHHHDDHSHDDHSDHSHDDHHHDDHSHDDHHHDDHSHDDSTHSHDETSIETTTRSPDSNNLASNHGNSTTNHTDIISHNVTKRGTDHNKECLSAETLYQSIKSSTRESLTKYDFKELCPALISQLDEGSCKSHNSLELSHDHSHDDCHDDHAHDHGHDHGQETSISQIGFSNIPAKVWGYSTIAVIIISLVGLLGVAVIPIMQKVFYNHLLQFLVASAVGALAGDALLHLLPHAMGGHVHGHHGDGDGHDHSEHEPHDPTMIYKGLCGLTGIYFFFWTERLLTIFTESKRKKKELKNKGKKYAEEIGGSAKIGDQCDGMMMSIHPNKALQNYAMEAHNEHCTIEFDPNAVSHRHGPCPKTDIETISINNEERLSMIGETPKRRHGHGHSHGIDGVPTSVASVAWMVILGDGIHNLCDGLAIGAAFVNSTTGGFSTSIAVLCHELPHEIGDFAMLLRAGMSTKQAVIYNCVSSILCFVGMLIGVAIGNVGGASLWVFATVAGMFLYIALVDMLPELSSVETRKGEHPLCHLVIQSIGMIIGAGIMLVIALYEDALIRILD